MTMLDWNDFKYILAIHRVGTLSDTARLLKVNQSTVSRTLQRIEAQTKGRIFQNASGRYQVTPEGKKYVDVAEKFDQAVEGLGFSEVPSTAISGVVRLTSIDGFIAGYLIPKLPQFRMQYPDISFEFNGSNETMDLLKRGYEVSLRLSREQKAGSLIQKKIADIGIGIYAKANLAGGQSSSLIKEFGSWIGYETALSEIPEEKWLRRKFKGQMPSVRVSGYLAMEKAIEAGVGIGLIPFFIGDKNPCLQRVSGSAATLIKSIWLISHPEIRRQQSVNCFVNWLTAEFKNDKKALLGVETK